VPARISADSRCVLWVNGHEVGRGPARSQPNRQLYDSYDLSPYLTVGANAIAVLVTYYGRPMSFWQPAPAGSNTEAALAALEINGLRYLHLVVHAEQAERLSAARRHPPDGCGGRHRGQRRSHHSRLVAQLDPWLAHLGGQRDRWSSTPTRDLV
jgi:hypothetical protein